MQVMDLLDGRYSATVPEFVIVDCRFEYEFSGGHIRGAVNINGKDALERRFLSQKLTTSAPVIIFHCEFSSKRAPDMCVKGGVGCETVSRV